MNYDDDYKVGDLVFISEYYDRLLHNDVRSLGIIIKIENIQLFTTAELDDSIKLFVIYTGNRIVTKAKFLLSKYDFCEAI